MHGSDRRGSFNLGWSARGDPAGADSKGLAIIEPFQPLRQGPPLIGRLRAAWSRVMHNTCNHEQAGDDDGDKTLLPAHRQFFFTGLSEA